MRGQAGKRAALAAGYITHPYLPPHRFTTTRRKPSERFPNASRRLVGRSARRRTKYPIARRQHQFCCNLTKWRGPKL
ncbi:hypothetical protein GUJ93_ZPchr0006g43318 [Zizania palustris]|uniref:Uncharacterized protein n=1 Tax=Zizania palustris TaxID=103762 RepID=A0A8J5W316_ZIZPA|nr:hypothetical protein GUJ93_ZPchr0006g43318 [Zizania palustris]